MLITSIFSFSHNVFKRLPFQGRLKSQLCGKELILYQSLWAARLCKKALKTMSGKRRNTGKKHFPVFQQCFLLFIETNSIFLLHLASSLANYAFDLNGPRISLSGKEYLIPTTDSFNITHSKCRALTLE